MRNDRRGVKGNEEVNERRGVCAVWVYAHLAWMGEWKQEDEGTYGFDTAWRPIAATVDTTATAAPTTAQIVACSLRVGFSNAKEGCS